MMLLRFCVILKRGFPVPPSSCACAPALMVIQLAVGGISGAPTLLSLSLQLCPQPHAPIHTHAHIHTRADARVLVPLSSLKPPGKGRSSPYLSCDRSAACSIFKKKKNSLCRLSNFWVKLCRHACVLLVRRVRRSSMCGYVRALVSLTASL